MFIKSEKHPSPPFTRNYLTHKTLNKKVKGEGLKTLFYIYDDSAVSVPSVAV